MKNAEIKFAKINIPIFSPKTQTFAPAEITSYTVLAYCKLLACRYIINFITFELLFTMKGLLLLTNIGLGDFVEVFQSHVGSQFLTFRILI
jgi:hypothetical protein